MKAYWLSLTVLAGLLVLLSTTCSSSEERVDLSDTEWELISLNGQRPINGTSITLLFDEATISGLAGCNNYMAQYETTGGGLTIPEVARTTKECQTPEGVMEQEASYLEALWAAATYEATKDDIKIRNEEGETTLIFTRKEMALNPTPVVTATLEPVSGATLTTHTASPSGLPSATSAAAVELSSAPTELFALTQVDWGVLAAGDGMARQVSFSYPIIRLDASRMASGW